MAFYTGIDCPVCGKAFAEGEDVVTCPVCGTPSHRSCYEKLGHCVNADKHGENFSFDLVSARKQAEPQLPTTDAAKPAGANSVPQAGASPAVPPTIPGFGVPGGTPVMNPFLGSTEKISGEKIGDVATVVRTNIPSYLKRFKKLGAGKKFSWNWSAVLFGPYWFFYRRMSKFGAMFMGIQLTLQILIQTIFASNLNQFNELFNGAFSEQTQSRLFFYADTANVEKMLGFARQANLLPFIIASFAAMLVLRVIFGVLANGLYKNHCVGIVHKVRTQIDDPELLERFTAAGYPVKTKTELLRMYLTQMGGTSIFGVLTGYMAYSLVTMLLSMVL